MSIRILGIESSCDETAAAVVVDGREILSSVVASQIDIHRKYGGVVPELASREHLRRIVPVVREAMERARIRLEDLDAIGVTQGPGLVGSLLVGITYGKTLAESLRKPLVPVNHLEGHIHAVFLEAHKSGTLPALPAVCLIVSGGHTVLYEVQPQDASHTDAGALWSYRKIGQTRDDAAGEAYDKVSKLLGLGYPGGPILDRLAAAAGNAAAPVKFGATKMRGNTFDFSFSGLKTAVLYHVRENPSYLPEIQERENAIARGERKFEQLLPLCGPRTLALVGEFQNAVVARFGRTHHARRGRVKCADGAGFWRSRGKPAVTCHLRRTRTQRRAQCIFPQPRTLYRQRGDDCRSSISAFPQSHSGRPFPERIGFAAYCVNRSVG